MIKNLISEACDKIEGFRAMNSQFVVKLTVKGSSERTIEAYTRTVMPIPVKLYNGFRSKVYNKKELI